jgi:cation transport protein ChaC
MVLDRGGQCRGMIQFIPRDQVIESLHRLFRRELVIRGSTNLPKWLACDFEGRRMRALSFVARRESPRYVGRKSLEEVASVLAYACGHAGPCAEYLRNTVAHLEELGISDRNLWQLQKLVAASIKRQRSGILPS